jgi:membrane fusion protein (multidrug efflux system)
MTTRKKLWIGAVLGLLLVVGFLAGTKALQIRSMIKAGASFTPPPESVASAQAKKVSFEGARSAVGTLVAARGVTLGAEIPGLIRQVSFESGHTVKQGTVLVKLDTSAEEAQLQAARAEASLARVNLERARTLRQAGSNAPADLDTAEARAQAASANVAALEATIAKKTIRAPFDGRVAIRQVERGQIVSPGTPVASLQSVTPIHADFYLPQQALAELRVGQKARLKADPFPGASWQGEITTVNPEVDVATRNVRVRATFKNDDGRLRPGMFVSVEVLSGDRREALVVPATSVLYAPYGDSVFALEEAKDGPAQGKLVARQKFVRLGERRGDFVAVTEGLQEGERVVAAGAFKLRNGAAVTLNDALAPDAKLAPAPADR